MALTLLEGPLDDVGWFSVDWRALVDLLDGC